MKKNLHFFNNSLKVLISLSALFVSFNAFSHTLYDKGVSPITVQALHTSAIMAYIWEEPGSLYGTNYYLHFHNSFGEEFDYELSEYQFNELKKKSWERDFSLEKFMHDEFIKIGYYGAGAFAATLAVCAVMVSLTGFCIPIP